MTQNKLYYHSPSGRYYKRVYEKRYQLLKKWEKRLAKSVSMRPPGAEREELKRQLQRNHDQKLASVSLEEVRREDYPEDYKVVPFQHFPRAISVHHLCQNQRQSAWPGAKYASL